MTAAATSSATTFAVPPTGAHTAPDSAAFTQMPRRAFAQTATDLTAAGRTDEAVCLKLKGARDAVMSKSCGRTRTWLRADGGNAQ